MSTNCPEDCTRIETSRFFAFADTVESLNFERTNQAMGGWHPLSDQTQSDYNDCVPRKASRQ